MSEAIEDRLDRWRKELLLLIEIFGEKYPPTEDGYDAVEADINARFKGFEEGVHAAVQWAKEQTDLYDFDHAGLLRDLLSEGPEDY